MVFTSFFIKKEFNKFQKDNRREMLVSIYCLWALVRSASKNLRKMHAIKNVWHPKLIIHWELMINGADFKFTGFQLVLNKGMCECVCVKDKETERKTAGWMNKLMHSEKGDLETHKKNSERKLNKKIPEGYRHRKTNWESHKRQSSQ